MTENPNDWEARLENKVNDLEKKMEKLADNLEKRAEGFGRSMEKRADDWAGEHTKGENHSRFWGIALIIVGLIWLGNNMDWFRYHVSWVPVLMVAGGVYLVLRHWKEKEPE